MKKSVPAPNPDAYIASLSGWQRLTAEHLRTAVLTARVKLDEVIKWGHLVYYAGGPVLLIRAEEKRVLFGFWRGKLLRGIDDRLKPGGKYEMATIELRKGDEVHPDIARRLTRKAARLNKTLGDPTKI
jgi:hypothetical protein